VCVGERTMRRVRRRQRGLPQKTSRRNCLPQRPVLTWSQGLSRPRHTSQQQSRPPRSPLRGRTPGPPKGAARCVAAGRDGARRLVDAPPIHTHPPCGPHNPHDAAAEGQPCNRREAAHPPLKGPGTPPAADSAAAGDGC
jgi:hypothetical protein